jgi:hypothetical protein
MIPYFFSFKITLNSLKLLKKNFIQFLSSVRFTIFKKPYKSTVENFVLSQFNANEITFDLIYYSKSKEICGKEYL